MTPPPTKNDRSSEYNRPRFFKIENVFMYCKILLLCSSIKVHKFWFKFTGIFRSNSLFLGANARKAVNEGRADTIPIFLCEIPHLFRRRIIDIDVALVTVAPPDKHGFCSLGTSVDCTRSAIQNARYIIGIIKAYSLMLHVDVQLFKVT